MAPRSSVSRSFLFSLVMGLAGLAPALAQTPARPAYVAPRAPDSKAPDLSGIWQVLDNSIDGSLEPHEASRGIRAGVGVVIDPADGKIPYKPEALAKRQENFRNRTNDPIQKCYKPGVPRLAYLPFPFQITQTPSFILFNYEFAHAVRNIYINDPERAKHLVGITFYNGDSRGHWEGDTLVVDVTNFNDDPDVPTWLDASGNYHSDALHVVERYTRTGPDTMTYEARIEDPKVFSRPWTIRILLYRHQEKNFRLLEYECQLYAGASTKQTER
jgi:hypothetical protein